MQLVNFWIFATFLIASATNQEVTTQSGVTTAIHNTSLTNTTASVASLSNNDQSNANATTATVLPTRVPGNEITTAKEPLVHVIETSSKQPISMVPKGNNIPANGNETDGKGSAKTDGKSGASKSTSGFLVISFIFLSLSVIYA